MSVKMVVPCLRCSDLFENSDKEIVV
jgi:hypothetical protein